jgi:hypothetical protein
LVLVLAFYGGIGRIVWGMFRSERDSKEGRG